MADFIHTFPDEVRLMWFAPLSIPKVLFFVVRYYIIVNNVFVALSILFYRVYGFSGRSRWMLVYLIFQFIAIHAASFTLLARYIGTVKFIQWPFPNLNCMPSEAKASLLGGVFATLLGSVIIAMLIMVSIAYRKHRGFNSALLQVFYRDGVFYFICLSALASANIGVSFAASTGYEYLFTQLEIDAHAILSTRMLLHLRDIAGRDDTFTGSGLSSFNDRLPMNSNRVPSSPMRFEKAPPSKRDRGGVVVTTSSATLYEE
ncbi:hypothetical protein D9611_000316 [Ephemerocybe angulata]|uniref:DUF6533 domain-containing protein n=1 Tax=Ephemerocybe angulata TaxID=980116 RepID=A0A8H5BM40_9AGAR|nr:hypothetical protein D9611_000316 [Tulosesus angulatus]